MLLTTLLESRLNQQIRNISTMHGGDINQVYLIETPENSYVLKRNSKERFPGMFVKEAMG
jgi:fructosamine-3-kinase